MAWCEPDSAATSGCERRGGKEKGEGRGKGRSVSQIPGHRASIRRFPRSAAGTGFFPGWSAPAFLQSSPVYRTVFPCRAARADRAQAAPPHESIHRHFFHRRRRRRHSGGGHGRPAFVPHLALPPLRPAGRCDQHLRRQTRDLVDWQRATLAGGGGAFDGPGRRHPHRIRFASRCRVW